MKSIFLSFLIFIAVFGVLKLGILDLLDNDFFTPIVFGLLIVVFICAFYFVGTPKIDDFKRVFKKEENNDKK